jgi:hypothetical protein
MSEQTISEALDTSYRPHGKPPPGQERKPRGEVVKNWVEVAAFIAAAIWALYTFVWTQYLQPRQVPVNISLNLEMQKVPDESTPLRAAAAASHDGLVAVELSVKATNPSSRSVFLPPSAWIARAYRVAPARARGDFPRAASGIVGQASLRPFEKYVETVHSEAVAAGRLFGDDVLKPNETIARRIVFHLPPAHYDAVEVYTCVPSTDQKDIGILWTNDGEGLHWQMTRNGKLLPPLSPDDKSSHEFQTSESRAALSLWR